MKSPYLLSSNYESIFEYDIVEEKLFFTKIIVYLDTDYDELVVKYRDNEMFVNTYSYSSFEEKYLYLRFKHKIRKIKYRVRNGILELNIYYKLFIF